MHLSRLLFYLSWLLCWPLSGAPGAPICKKISARESCTYQDYFLVYKPLGSRKAHVRNTPPPGGMGQGAGGKGWLAGWLGWLGWLAGLAGLGCWQARLGWLAWLAWAGLAGLAGWPGLLAGWAGLGWAG